MTEAAPDIRYTPAADGVALRYEVAGSGSPVVFLHGGLAGRDSFFRQRPAFEPSFRVILRDLRGHNGAGGSPLPDGYAFDTTESGDMLAVLDAEGIERADVVGHSTGGAIAAAFAIAHPKRVARVLLIEPSLVALASPELQQAEAALGARVESAQTPEEAGYILIDRVAGGPGWRGRVRTGMLAQIDAGAGVIREQHRALRAYRFDARALAALGPRLLFIFGGDSPALFRSIESGARAAAPDARFLTVEGAGHSCYVQRADEVNEAMLAFLHEPRTGD